MCMYMRACRIFQMLICRAMRLQILFASIYMQLAISVYTYTYITYKSMYEISCSGSVV